MLISIRYATYTVQFGSESAVRRLDMHECPLAIQNEFLKRIGFKLHEPVTDESRNGSNSGSKYSYRSSNDFSSTHARRKECPDGGDDEQDARQLGLSYELTYFVRFYAGKLTKVIDSW